MSNASLGRAIQISELARAETLAAPRPGMTPRALTPRALTLIGT